MDIFGTPHSESLHLTERYHRLDFGHLDLEMTFDDPVMFTKPFTIKQYMDKTVAPPPEARP